MAVENDLIRKNPLGFELASVVVNDSVTREAISRKQERDLLKFIKEDQHLRRNIGLMRSYKKMIKILFVCHGNICRSPMAEFVMKDLVKKAGLEREFQIASAATSREEIGNDVHPGTKGKLREMEVPFSRRRAIQLTATDGREYDYLIGMDRYNLRNMRAIVREEDWHKISLLLDFCGESRDVADPWYTGDFDATWDDVDRGCRALLKKLFPTHQTV